MSIEFLVGEKPLSLLPLVAMKSHVDNQIDSKDDNQYAPDSKPARRWITLGDKRHQNQRDERRNPKEGTKPREPPDGVRNIPNWHQSNALPQRSVSSRLLALLTRHFCVRQLTAPLR